MSLLFRDNNGNETHIAGLNGVSGELVPSVSLYQSGTVNLPSQPAHSQTDNLSATFAAPMPDTDYVVSFDTLTGNQGYRVFQLQTKSVNGFTFTAFNADVGEADATSVNWSAFKLMTDETTQLDEAQIALNKQDITSIKGKIPSNASSSNQLATQFDTVKRINYSINGTVDAVEDTKALVNHILTLGEGSYVGEFKRTGITFGSFRLTYFTDGDGSISISGIVTYSISNTNDSTYQISYVLSHGSDTPYWNIDELVTARENNFKYQVLTTDSDLNTAKASGTYSIYISDATSQATNHAPSYGWIQLIVIQMNNSSSFCNQIAFRDDTIYIRKCGNDIWSDWKQITDDLTSGTLTIPAQTLANGAYAEIQIPLVPGDFYCGRIDFADLPSQNMSLSYNDFSGSFQDTKGTNQRTQDVLYPIGRANLGVLHVYLTNYTGSPVTISNIGVTYYLEHHKAQ